MIAISATPGAADAARLVQLDEPRPGENELLVEMLALGVCGTDREIVGGLIRSWLVELMPDGLRDNPDLRELSTYVEDTSEVKRVLSWALDRDIPSPAISDSQQGQMVYRDLDSRSAKAVALLRHGFGGHPVHRRTEQLVRT